MSEKRKYRQFTPEQKVEVVLAGLRGDRSVRDVCREYEISEALFYQWPTSSSKRQDRAGHAAEQEIPGSGAAAFSASSSASS